MKRIAQSKKKTTFAFRNGKVTKKHQVTNIERDKKTVRMMIDLYAKHHPDFDKSLADYACRRLDHCHYGNDKPACKDCPVHCYAPEKREEIRKVMRWTGPRMLFYSPLATLRHLWQSMRK